ncbi:MAG: hypothetical protein RMH84_05385 [Sulfolobales archaeon]|nr:hypothetical protein [Sulfolobales archaeon]MDW8011008.1 hypothetical protein [Sulfolobales archaeon]
MPVIYRCSSCSYILYEFLKVGQDSYGLPTPSELLARIGSRCPSCGKKLRPPTLEDIKVSPYRARKSSVSDLSVHSSRGGRVI